MLRGIGLVFTVGILLPTCLAFEEKDIQCQDPFDLNNTVTLKSSLICDEIQNCFQGLDERRDLCGNVHHVQLRSDHRDSLSIQLRWETTPHHSGIWGPTAEEQRAAMFGPREAPDGYFLTWTSAAGSSTVNLEGSSQTESRIDDLRPGTSYTFLLRPYIVLKGSTRGYRVGMASSLTVSTRLSDPLNVTLTALDKGRAVVSWHAIGYVEYFEVRISRPYDPYQRWDSQKGTALRTIAIEGANVESRTYSAIVTVPSPDAEFGVRSCVGSTCSATVTLHQTARSIEPSPSITRVAALSDTSFALGWEVLNDDQDTYDGFAVRYCALSSGPCHETTVGSGSRSVTVNHLRANTTYSINLHLRLTKPWKPMVLSKPGTAAVSTWATVPLPPVLTDKPVLSGALTVLYEWTIYNSSLGYMQFSLDGKEWQNCTEPFHCSLSTVRRSFPVNGVMQLWNLRPYTSYTFFVRGCNDNGCGPHSRVQHTTEIREPSAPLNLQIASFENNTAHVQWDPPSQPAGPLDGYEVSWECPGKSTAYIEVASTEAWIADLPEGNNCSWSVLAYHYTPEDHLLPGKRNHWNVQPETRQSETHAETSAAPLSFFFGTATVPTWEDTRQEKEDGDYY